MTSWVRVHTSDASTEDPQNLITTFKLLIIISWLTTTKKGYKTTSRPMQTALHGQLMLNTREGYGGKANAKVPFKSHFLTRNEQANCVFRQLQQRRLVHAGHPVKGGYREESHLQSSKYLPLVSHYVGARGSDFSKCCGFQSSTQQQLTPAKALDGS